MVEVLAGYCKLSHQRKQIEELIGMVPDGRDDEPDRVVRHARRLRSHQLDVLIDAYQSGATVYELAERFGISRQTVSEHLHRQGVRLRLQGLSPSQIEVAVEMYGQGLSLAKIAAQLGVHAGTVHKRLRERGVRMRDTHGRER